ncbi:MAG: adenylate/guanylate cyclase domain-containing protein [bacterium]
MRRSLELAEPFMVAAGLLGLLGQPLFHLVWRFGFPQPYENLALRMVAGLSCLPLILRNHWPARWEGALGIYWITAVFFNLPFLFSFFLLQNALSQVWVFSVLGGMFFLTFLVRLEMAVILFFSGTALAYGVHAGLSPQAVALRDYLQVLVLSLFPMLFGGVVNYQLHRARELQRAFEARLRRITVENANLVKEQNQLLSRFLSNSIITRLRRFQSLYGLEEALDRVTRQEKRFCAIMQADVRNFTKMFGQDSEFEVARLIHRCFAGISEVGQDLAVIKPVGDSIFVYIDEEGGRETAVHNILALAITFVQSVERINRTLVEKSGKALNFGIAVHAGEVIYGNLAADTLIDPTIIGIHVNKTARLEELTKQPRIAELVGPNAILLSEQIAFYAANFIRGQHLIPLPLAEMGLTLRDFPQEKMVHALPARHIAEYLAQAEQKISDQRQGLVLAPERMPANRHQGVPYFYESQGTGANTSWRAMIDVSLLPPKTVTHYAMHALDDLEYEINYMDGQWLIISTAPSPGEYDEVEMESRIVTIIDALKAASGQQPG